MMAVLTVCWASISPACEDEVLGLFVLYSFLGAGLWRIRI